MSIKGSFRVSGEGEILNLFQKSNFDAGKIMPVAIELKYRDKISSIIKEEFANPTDAFVRFFAAQIYKKKFTESARKQFREIVKNSLDQYFNDNQAIIDTQPPPGPPVDKGIAALLEYITSSDVRKILESLIADLPSWKKDKISIEPIKHTISVKVGGKLLMYLSPRRNKFIVDIKNPEGKWVGHPVKSNEDLNKLMDIMKGNMEKKLK